MQLSRMLLCVLALSLAAGWRLCLAAEDKPTKQPLVNAHAHNDYLHEHPLRDALDHGFISVEADIFLVEGELLVGHTVFDLKRERTLQSLYLDPLSQRAKAGGGKIYRDGPPLVLLIDVKTAAAATYAALAKVLARYDDLLSVVRDGKFEPQAVTAIVTGSQAREAIRAEAVRYAGYDGRPADLDSDVPTHLMPLVSDDWSKHFEWRGTGDMPQAEREKLRAIVAKAHKSGRQLRFWGAPDNAATWRELRAAGVDLINTDDLAGLEKFLRELIQ